MDEEQVNTVEEIEKKSIWTSVTPLSRILAMMLFIALPFVGFWVGYKYAPEKIVEVEKVVKEVVEKTNVNNEYKNTSFSIEGDTVQLVDGYSEVGVVPSSTSRTVTRYFGNDLVTDLDGDGDDDIAFIITQETGGSGVFFYAVAAINTKDGYIGSDGYLLGDRIAPQATTLSPNPHHKYVVVFNYADRVPEEPMSVQPSVGKSVYLKLVPETMHWAIVEPDFEGEESGENSGEVSLPVGYSLDKYRIEEVTGPVCIQDTECSLPMDYAIRSNCPYTSLCIENKCSVVCPTFEYNP